MYHTSATPQCLTQTFQRSNSPVFFTGCVDSVKTSNRMSQDSSVHDEKTIENMLSLEDLQKLGLVLNSLLMNKKQSYHHSPSDLQAKYMQNPVQHHPLPPPVQHHSRESLGESVCSRDSGIGTSRPSSPSVTLGVTVMEETKSGECTNLKIETGEKNQEEVSSSQFIPCAVKRKHPEDNANKGKKPSTVNKAFCNSTHCTSNSEDSKNKDHDASSQFIPSSSHSSPSEVKRKLLSPPNIGKRPRISHLLPSPVPGNQPPYLCNNSPWDQVSKTIWQLYLDNRQTSDVYNMKMALRNQLHEILIDTFPYCGLYVVGSSMSGLGANSSDMDMCLMLTHSEIDQELEATNILHVVHDIFSRYNFLLNVELIHAKVPILRFKDSMSGIEVDLNINNAVGIRNTQLLNSYARIDERVPPLVLLAKLWARSHDINDAKNHTLSSYSLVLMVIHYLQYGCVPPVLPCLQKLQQDKFQPHSDVSKLKLFEDLPPFHSKNVQTLGELFVGFLHYYAAEFNFSNSVISVRIGGIIPKRVAMNYTSPKNKKGHWKCISIEEPFDCTNTARAVFSEAAFYHILEVFTRSWHLLRESRDLHTIIDVRRWTLQ